MSKWVTRLLMLCALGIFVISQLVSNKALSLSFKIPLESIHGVDASRAPQEQQLKEASTEQPRQQQQQQPAIENELTKKSEGRDDTILSQSYHQIPLRELTRSSQGKPDCPVATFAVEDQIPSSNFTSSQTPGGHTANIPKIIHQTSRTRCAVKEFFDSANKWKALGDEWEYHFHDDEAMDRLIHNVHPAFPMLPLVWNNCVKQGAMKADLWRMLVLWEYGGIFADLDSPPNHFAVTEKSIQPGDDAIFVVDKDLTTSFHFMAMTPKHPIAFLSLEMAIHNMVTFNRYGNLKPKGKMNPVKLTGPSALRSAVKLHLFLGDHSNDGTFDKGSLLAGNYQGGVNSKSFRILETLENDFDYWVVRDSHGQGRKSKFYEYMNMTHFSKDLKTESKLMSVSCGVAIMKDLELKRKKSAAENEHRQLPLVELTNSPITTKCSDSGAAVLVENRMVAANATENSLKRKIPQNIHMTHPSRCITTQENSNNSVDKWKSLFGDWNFFLHDDSAMDRFFLQHSHPAFSKLKLVYQSGATMLHRSIKTYLWKLLVLWEYGGVVVTDTAVPNHLMTGTIRSDDDAVLILNMVEGGGPSEFSYSMDFMAVAPYHPIIFFALQIATFSMITEGDHKSNVTTTACQLSMLQQQSIYDALKEGVARFLNLHPANVLKTVQAAKGMSMPGQGERSVRMLGSYDSNFFVLGTGSNTTAARRCTDSDESNEPSETNCVSSLLKII